jgi:hypothetical protein
MHQVIDYSMRQVQQLATEMLSAGVRLAEACLDLCQFESAVEHGQALLCCAATLLERIERMLQARCAVSPEFESIDQKWAEGL